MTKASTSAVPADTGGSTSRIAHPPRRRRGRPRTRPAPLLLVDGHRFQALSEPAGFEDGDVDAVETGPELLDMAFDGDPANAGVRFFEDQSDGLRGHLRVRMRRTVE